MAGAIITLLSTVAVGATSYGVAEWLAARWGRSPTRNSAG